MLELLQLASEVELDLEDTEDRGTKWLVNCNAAQNWTCLYESLNNCSVIDMKMNGSFFFEKSSFDVAIDG